MTEAELLTLIHGGENICVEFKKSTNDITKDVYDTVCAFSNRCLLYTSDAADEL